MSMSVPKPASQQRREREQQEVHSSSSHHPHSHHHPSSLNNNNNNNNANYRKGGGGAGQPRSATVSPATGPVPVSGIPSAPSTKNSAHNHSVHNSSNPNGGHNSGGGLSPAPTATVAPSDNNQTQPVKSSPSLLPRNLVPSPLLNPMPRSLQQGGGSTSSPGLPPMGTPPPPPNTGTFRPPAPFSLGESAMASVPGGLQDKSGRRIDPTKFKTDLCRNYEQTGQCTFKGCTFAHGSDELRQPPKGGLGPGGSQLSPQLYVNHLADILLAEVNGEVHAHVEHQETNRRLELALREEQAARQKTLKELAVAEKEVDDLKAAGIAKDAVLLNLKRKLKGSAGAGVMFGSQ